MPTCCHRARITRCLSGVTVQRRRWCTVSRTTQQGGDGQCEPSCSAPALGSGAGRHFSWVCRSARPHVTKLSLPRARTTPTADPSAAASQPFPEQCMHTDMLHIDASLLAGRGSEADASRCAHCSCGRDGPSLACCCSPPRPAPTTLFADEGAFRMTGMTGACVPPSPSVTVSTEVGAQHAPTRPMSPLLPWCLAQQQHRLLQESQVGRQF